MISGKLQDVYIMGILIIPSSKRAAFYAELERSKSFSARVTKLSNCLDMYRDSRALIGRGFRHILLLSPRTR